ncbi:MAG TPA: SAM-dependent methyltransferase, partial [Mycobacterium sp.]|nr:SAM-dependent methyltransferase [Mycobacterium sp.]
GGRLVVLTTALHDSGEPGFGPLLDAMMDALDELRADGLLTDDELHRMSIPMVGRRAADFLAPFAPSGKFERLSIEHLEVFDAEDRFWARYRVDKDAKAFGAQWAAFARASVFPALATAIDDESRLATFLDRLEAGIATRLAAAPQQLQIPLARLELVKRKSV